VDDLFSGYSARPAWDEILEGPGRPRDVARGLYATLSSLKPAELDERSAERDRAFRERGITFSLSGEERPFPLDPIPRPISSTEWTSVEAGVRQRVRALEALLHDLYGAGECLADGIVSRRVVMSATNFERRAWGIEPPNGVRIHVAGIDLVRDAAGRFCVLEDNVRIPSGVSYVLENRRAMTRVFPELFASERILPVDDYPIKLLAALRAAAPPRSRGEPTVVVLTPGVHNSAYFEHTFLARRMGVELVEGRDLICKSNVLYVQTTEGEQRIDVVYRRVDDAWLDPVQFDPGSMLGCPGLLNAARAGNVSIANAVGNGVADDKLMYTYVPDLIRYFLGEEPILPNVTTYRLEEREQLELAMKRIGELVLKPVSGSGGSGILVGPHASEQELAAAETTVRADPRGWIAQEVVLLSTAPTQIGSKLEPRHVDLRPFAINDGRDVWVLPGGLTRVALRRGSLVVNSSQGGGSKDTWVLAGTDTEKGEGAPGGSGAAGRSGGAGRPGGAGGGAAPTGPFARSRALHEPDRGPGLDPATSQQQQQQQQSHSQQARAARPGCVRRAVGHRC
jgi:uncharacterized circularly permuted ATP-grasp superfamily protein